MVGYGLSATRKVILELVPRDGPICEISAPGRLSTRSWTTEKYGQKTRRYTLITSNMALVLLHSPTWPHHGAKLDTVGSTTARWARQGSLGLYVYNFNLLTLTCESKFQTFPCINLTISRPLVKVIIFIKMIWTYRFLQTRRLLCKGRFFFFSSNTANTDNWHEY